MWAKSISIFVYGLRDGNLHFTRNEKAAFGVGLDVPFFIFGPTADCTFYFRHLAPESVAMKLKLCNISILGEIFNNIVSKQGGLRCCHIHGSHS